VSPAILPNEFAFGASIVEQLKVSFFYRTKTLLVVVAAIVPSTAYLVLLRRVVKTSAKASEPLQDEQGLVAKPVERETIGEKGL
jgi:hypothetical protein